MPIIIRQANDNDADIIVRFNLALAEESEGRRLDRGTVDAGVEAVLRDPAKGLYFLAKENQAIIGQLMLTREWSDWRNGSFWWIQSVYVKAERRGRGVFRALYQHVLNEAKRTPNVCGLRLYVDKDNRTATEVYRRSGMQVTHYDMLEVDFGARG